ncbi:Hypothetical predicted protein [Pelobates cultripes]|nr:Hypothetical predicted protein [Pelobates cultripes]
MEGHVILDICEGKETVILKKVKQDVVGKSIDEEKTHGEMQKEICLCNLEQERQSKIKGEIKEYDEKLLYNLEHEDKIQINLLDNLEQERQCEEQIEKELDNLEQERQCEVQVEKGLDNLEKERQCEVRVEKGLDNLEHDRQCVVQVEKELDNLEHDRQCEVQVEKELDNLEKERQCEVRVEKGLDNLEHDRQCVVQVEKELDNLEHDRQCEVQVEKELDNLEQERQCEVRVEKGLDNLEHDRQCVVRVEKGLDNLEHDRQCVVQVEKELDNLEQERQCEVRVEKGLDNLEHDRQCEVQVELELYNLEHDRQCEVQVEKGLDNLEQERQCEVQVEKELDNLEQERQCEVQVEKQLDCLEQERQWEVQAELELYNLEHDRQCEVQVEKGLDNLEQEKLIDMQRDTGIETQERDGEAVRKESGYRIKAELDKIKSQRYFSESMPEMKVPAEAKREFTTNFKHSTEMKSNSERPYNGDKKDLNCHRKHLEEDVLITKALDNEPTEHKPDCMKYLFHLEPEGGLWAAESPRDGEQPMNILCDQELSSCDAVWDWFSEVESATRNIVRFENENIDFRGPEEQVILPTNITGYEECDSEFSTENATITDSQDDGRRPSHRCVDVGLYIQGCEIMGSRDLKLKVEDMVQSLVEEASLRLFCYSQDLHSSG